MFQLSKAVFINFVCPVKRFSLFLTLVLYTNQWHSELVVCDLNCVAFYYSWKLTEYTTQTMYGTVN